MKNGESGWGYGRGEPGVVISFTRFFGFYAAPDGSDSKSFEKFTSDDAKLMFVFFFPSKKKRANSD